jgi:hypothetical protein
MVFSVARSKASGGCLQCNAVGGSRNTCRRRRHPLVGTLSGEFSSNYAIELDLTLRWIQTASK